MLLCPLGWMMNVLADAGFSGVELLLTHNSETRDPDKILGFAEQASLQVPVVHGPYMLALRNVLGTNYAEKTQRSLDLAAQCGAKTMVAHAPLRWERAALSWALQHASAEAARYGVRFAMENLFPVFGMHFSSVVTPDDLSPFDHVVFDTSHFAVARVDLFEAWHRLRDRVVHLHVSDNFGNGKDSHAPIGSGVLPLPTFLAHVGRSGYSETITLEVDVRAFADDRRSLVTFLSEERRKVERYLAGDIPESVRLRSLAASPSDSG